MGLLGLNVSKCNMPHMIFLDNSLKYNLKLQTNILAHELGHYFTSTGDSLTRNNYIDRVLSGKCENKADKWACEFLITEIELVDAINKNIHCTHDIAEYLGVDLEILSQRLEYLARNKQTLDLGNNKYLVLTNLPNIFVYEPITF